MSDYLLRLLAAVAAAMSLSLMAEFTKVRPPGSSEGRWCRDAEDEWGESDCPERANLCEEPLYEVLMREQCPYTCDWCDDAAYDGGVSEDDEDYSSGYRAAEMGGKETPVQAVHPYFPWSLNKSVDRFLRVCVRRLPEKRHL